MDDRLRGRDFVTDVDWSGEELERVFELAAGLKQKFRRGDPTLLLPHQTLFMMFFEQSTRTRNSFEAGMTQLGGHAHDLTPDKMQISHGETPWDTGKVLSRYGHAIAIRNCFWKRGQPLPARSGRGGLGAGLQHAVRLVASLPGAWRIS